MPYSPEDYDEEIDDEEDCCEHGIPYDEDCEECDDAAA